MGLPRPMKGGAVYCWTCRFRADASRKIAFGTRQSVAPYQVIGLWKEMEIGTTEEDVSIEFSMPSDDPSMIPFILLGDSDIPVELSDYSLEMISDVPLETTSIQRDASEDGIAESQESEGISESHATEPDPSDEENAVTEG